MSLRYLLDTNAISEPFRRSPSPTLLGQLRKHRAECALSSTIWHELLFGLERLPESARKKELARFLDQVAATLPILPYDERAARWHAAERARLRTRTPPFVDGQIAAVAATNDLTLVTANVRDFRPFSSLTVEDWLS